MKKIDRTGEEGVNRQGLKMRIIEYSNNKQVRILFVDSGITRVATYLNFKRGKVYPTWKNNKGGKPAKEGKVTLGSQYEIDDRTARMAIAVSGALAVGLIVLGGLIGWGIVSLADWLC